MILIGGKGLFQLVDCSEDLTANKFGQIKFRGKGQYGEILLQLKIKLEENGRKSERSASIRFEIVKVTDKRTYEEWDFENCVMTKTLKVMVSDKEFKPETPVKADLQTELENYDKIKKEELSPDNHAKKFICRLAGVRTGC